MHPPLARSLWFVIATALAGTANAAPPESGQAAQIGAAAGNIAELERIAAAQAASGQPAPAPAGPGADAAPSAVRAAAPGVQAGSFELRLGLGLCGRDHFRGRHDRVDRAQ
jgi:hypothetical protein